MSDSVGPVAVEDTEQDAAEEREADRRKATEGTEPDAGRTREEPMTGACLAEATDSGAKAAESDPDALADESVSDTVECVPESAQAPTTASAHRSRTLRRWAAPVLIAVAAALVVATGWSVARHRDDAALAAAHREVGTAAAEAATAILSYKPDTVASDLARARSHLSGEFATYFEKLGNEVVRPAAAGRHMSSAATVTATSVVSVDSDHAVALVFVSQVTTADDLKQPTTVSSSLRLELRDVGGRWLVTKLDTL